MSAAPLPTPALPPLPPRLIAALLAQAAALRRCGAAPSHPNRRNLLRAAGQSEAEAADLRLMGLLRPPPAAAGPEAEAEAEAEAETDAFDIAASLGAPR